MNLQSRILACLEKHAMRRSLLQALLPDVSPTALDCAIKGLKDSRQIVLRMGHFELVSMPGASLPETSKLTPTVIRKPPRPIQCGQPLTHREEEIRELISAGMDRTAIAAKLFIAEKSVRQHLANVYRKLGVRRRGELVARAAETN